MGEEERNDKFESIKKEALERDTKLSEDEEAMTAITMANIDKAFWDFVDKSKTKMVPQTDNISYYDKIIDVIEHWGEYREKYRKSGAHRRY